MARSIVLVIAGASLATVVVAAQDRLKSAPGYERAQQLTREAGTAVRGGALAAVWREDGLALEYTRDGARYRFDLRTRQETSIPASTDAPPHAVGGAPARGRQFEKSASPDGSLVAFYRDRNVWLSAPDGARERAVTTDGSAERRTKYGTASWVYGEELSQRTAMWWSPDSRKLAFYRFDEQSVRDSYVILNQTLMQPSLETEAYPNAGTPNPVVDLFVYDVDRAEKVRVDVRDGKPFDDESAGQYVYRPVWTADSRELTFLRMNRRQNVQEVVAANPATGSCRVVLREEWPSGWVMSEPRLVFLSDGRRFIWESQRNGWDNFYLYDLTGRLIAPLTTSTTFEAASLVKIDERANALFYTARDGDSPLKLQLHRVGLDGANDRRLTDPAFHHTIGGCIPSLGSRPESMPTPGPCAIAPDSSHFVDIYQTHDTPPATRVVDAATGRVVADLARSDTTKFDALGLKKAELFTFAAADGRTTLRGVIQFPSTFDPARKYPVLVNVYGGPEFASNTARETFVTPSPLAEYGFLIVNLDSRAIPGLGKRTLDALYQKLGQTEIDDMAAGVRALAGRPYVDPSRVGIFGTSYGGYAALMELLRYPDVFAAASVSSPPTDWRNYDTIYTERYMWTPDGNASGYQAGSALTYAKNLRGRLLIYYGSADDNVHPSNALQLIKALQEAGLSHDVQVGPDRGHSAVNQDRMMEFFIEVFKPGE